MIGFIFSWKNLAKHGVGSEDGGRLSRRRWQYLTTCNARRNLQVCCQLVDLFFTWSDTNRSSSSLTFTHKASWEEQVILSFALTELMMCHYQAAHGLFDRFIQWSMYRVTFLTGPAQKSSKYGTGPTQQQKSNLSTLVPPKAQMLAKFSTSNFSVWKNTGFFCRKSQFISYRGLCNASLGTTSRTWWSDLFSRWRRGLDLVLL